MDIRNGNNDDGWALRLNGGPDQDEDEDADEVEDEDRGYGLMHDGKHKAFLQEDKALKGDIGVLYNPIRKTLSYFLNR